MLVTMDIQDKWQKDPEQFDNIIHVSMQFSIIYE